MNITIYALVIYLNGQPIPSDQPHFFEKQSDCKEIADFLMSAYEEFTDNVTISCEKLVYKEEEKEQ